MLNLKIYCRVHNCSTLEPILTTGVDPHSHILSPEISLLTYSHVSAFQTTFLRDICLVLCQTQSSNIVAHEYSSLLIGHPVTWYISTNICARRSVNIYGITSKKTSVHLQYCLVSQQQNKNRSCVAFIIVTVYDVYQQKICISI